MLFTCVDSNVPQDKQDPNTITNTASIDDVLPSIKYALKDGAKSFAFCSHIGRPSGEKSEKLYIAPMAKVVGEKLGRPVQLTEDSEAEAACADPAPGSVILLENSHLYVEEEVTGEKTVGTRSGLILRRSTPPL